MLDEVGCCWTSMDPYSGFVSSVAFSPHQQGLVHVSGDDGSGLYYSQDGGVSWNISQSPLDQSTYEFGFDPSRPNVVYAPNHFGRGFLLSIDGGVSYDFTRAIGLPVLDGNAAVVNSITVLSDSSVYVGMGKFSDVGPPGGAVYHSSNDGDSFSQLNASELGGGDFVVAKVLSGVVPVSPSSSEEILVVATVDGRIKMRQPATDTSSSFFDVSLPLPLDGVISDASLSANGLYVLTSAPSLYRVDFANASNSILVRLNESIAPGALWYKLTTHSPDQSIRNDVMYVGSTVGVVLDSPATHYGLFRVEAPLGAPSITQLSATSSGIHGISVFQTSVDPFNPQNVVMGTLGDGAKRSFDGGIQWSSADVHSPSSCIAWAVDVEDVDHVVLGQTEGLARTPGIFESFDAGDTWSVASTAPAEPSFDANALLVVRGTRTMLASPSMGVRGWPGVWRRPLGEHQWTPVLDDAVVMDRFLQPNGSDVVFALGVTPIDCSIASCANGAQTSTLFNVGVYVSLDDGANWTLRENKLFLDVAFHPTVAGHAVGAVFQDDVYATEDYFASPSTPLGLSSLLPGPNLTAVSIGQINGVEDLVILAATQGARLFAGLGYGGGSGPLEWVEVASPTTPNTLIRYVVPLRVDGMELFAMNAWAGDPIATAPTPLTGVFLGGAWSSTTTGNASVEWQWTLAIEGMAPSTMMWALARGPQPNTLTGANWGGGVWKAECHAQGVTCHDEDTSSGGTRAMPSMMGDGAYTSSSSSWRSWWLW